METVSSVLVLVPSSLNGMCSVLMYMAMFFLDVTIDGVEGIGSMSLREMHDWVEEYVDQAT
ncbi:hypothetical protein SETIT_2G116900v2 [Setaria italica]|uniref:Uncharacterized protein n=2 Tax=Setaria TaxID=4554 RepID=A0A368PY95_SETIT|nr:hypothetical protein SETIT_2G116900v2 [Setaria italica]TKW31706.1 hypothetical protein SEVIR_2G123200v2 [Setaria viridis]